MPRLGYMIVDGLALALVGIGLTAVVVSYERNVPDPGEPRAAVAEVASTWMDPETTGSISPPQRRPAEAARGRGARGEAESHPSTGGSAWIDPPRR